MRRRTTKITFTHPPNELFYVLSGEMTLCTWTGNTPLDRGYDRIRSADHPHSGFRVGGDDPLHVLAIFAPAGMAGFFERG